MRPARIRTCIMKKKEDTPLNDVLVVILLINALLGVFQMIAFISSIGDNTMGSVVGLLATAISLYGIYLILCLKKIGLFLLLFPKILEIVIMSVVSFDGYIGTIVIDLAAVVIIMLLMLLKKNGKSAYQLLWNDYPSDKQ